MEKGSLADAKLNGRILVLFTAGFLAGLALIYIGQESLVVNADFLDSFSVGRMGVLDIDSSMLFFYSIKQRLAPAVLLAVLAVAGIGGMAVSCIWSGPDFVQGRFCQCSLSGTASAGFSFFQEEFSRRSCFWRRPICSFSGGARVFRIGYTMAVTGAAQEENGERFV